MSQREPFEYIEIDVDYCSLTYGAGACQAALGTTGTRKCFNMFAHCQDQENFAKTTLTQRFCKPVQRIPLDQTYYPVLQDARVTTSTVNIGGTDSKLSALGRRGTLTARLKDFGHHDRGIDKYASERVSGAAQEDAVGYDPAERGTYFTKMRSRWPYYANRPMRYVVGYIDGGTLVVDKVRHYIIVEMTIDVRSGGSNDVTIKAKDVLDLADNKKAVCPAPNNGSLLSDISATATALTLSPEGIGDDEYPASGKATIGSELVAYTRSGDEVTITERGLSGTTQASHSEGDAFQIAYSIFKQRIDDTIAELLRDYAGVPEAFLPLAEWEAEITRWAGTLFLTTDILKPEGVAKLVGELAVLGVSIWWDDVAQKVGLKVIRPVDDDTVYELNDDSSIKEIAIEDRDEDRLTEVAFFSVIGDASGSAKEPENFDRQRYTIDVLSKSENAYGDTKKLDIFTRWLNHGDDRSVRIMSRRTLARLRTPPKRYKMTLDRDLDAIGLTDVLRVTSRIVTDETGAPETLLMQVVSKAPLRAGHDFEIVAQAYLYEGRFGYITANDFPVYNSASEAQRTAGAFLVGDTLKFDDDTQAYEII